MKEILSQEIVNMKCLSFRLIDWYLMPILAAFQLTRGVNKFYILDTQKTLKNKSYSSINPIF